MVYWSVSSMILYIIMGIVSMLSVLYIKKIEKLGMRRTIDFLVILFIWFVIWIFITVFRKVDINIGGSDAITYKEYFDECLDPNLNSLYATHLDEGFKLLTKTIRLITSDYHAYFFVIYSIILISYMVFISEFMPTTFSAIPMILVFFLFLRGFTSIRTNISVAFMLLSFVSLKRKHYIRTALFFILCISMHIASLLCLPFYVFYLIFKNKQLKLWEWVLLYALVFVGIQIVQPILINATDLNGAYSSYASNNLNSSFFGSNGGWKIAFSQLLLLILFALFYKPLRRMVKTFDNKDKKRYQLIYLMCAYDFLMIPVYFKLGIWRGYEYFYIPRLILWGGIINCVSQFISQDNKCKNIVNIVSCVLFISWMIFRVYSTYEDSCLMPYIFQLIGG